MSVASIDQKTFTQVGDKVKLRCRGSNFIVRVDGAFTGTIVVKKEFRRLSSAPSDFATLKTITAPTAEPEWFPTTKDSKNEFIHVECTALSSGTPVVSLAEM